MENSIQKLTEKITSYNIFNNLLPGIVFCYLIERFSNITLTTNKLLEDFFIYYFIGIVISRIGSLFIKWFLEKIGIVQPKSPILNPTSYENYIEASKSDSFLKILNETNNTYRTLIALFTSILAIVLYEHLLSDTLHTLITIKFGLNMKIVLLIILCAFLIFLFTLSYKKQSQFIESRVTHYIKTKNKLWKVVNSWAL